MSQKQFAEITCRAGSQDASLFETVVNIGIDAYLEAFTKSTFSYRDTAVGPRLVCKFHIDELPLLFRRLSEVADDTDDESLCEIAQSWADDIRDLEVFPK